MVRLGILGTATLAALALAASAVSAAPAGRVLVDYELGGGFFFEGSNAYFRIKTTTGKVVLKRRFDVGERRELDAELEPNRYVLVTYERPCDATCDYLDPPTARCKTRFRIRPERTLEIHVRVDRPNGSCSHTVTKRLDPLIDVP